MNLLFLSAGRRVELIQAFHRSVTKLGASTLIVASDMDLLAPALAAANIAQRLPRSSDPTFLDELLACCKRHNVKYVLPLIDPDIVLLSKWRTLLESAGVTPLICNDRAVHIASDKLLTARFFESIGVPSPRSWAVSEVDLAEAHGLPLFIKPRDGSSSQNVFRVNTVEELRFFAKYVPNAIIQECLAGPEITCDITADHTGNLLGIVLRKRIKTRCGEVSQGVTIYDEHILERCKDIAAALSIVGPINVQCMWRGETPCFTEINARFGGGAPLSIAAGMDFPTMMLSRMLGIGSQGQAIAQYDEGVYMTRFDQSNFTRQS
jgi:carbamoyl-phosphate synthase large subunit